MIFFCSCPRYHFVSSISNVSTEKKIQELLNDKKFNKIHFFSLDFFSLSLRFHPYLLNGEGVSRVGMQEMLIRFLLSFIHFLLHP